MISLSKEDFCSKKTHDAVAVIGSGYSVNAVGPATWRLIKEKYDTIGFNWSCKLHMPMTWYVVREQAASPKRVGLGQTVTDFIKDMERTPSTLIVKDMSYRIDNYIHAHNTYRFEHKGRLFNEIVGHCSVKNFRDDIFKHGIHHGKNTMTDVLHFVVAMGYRKILFVGVDLTDSRYFWLPYDQPSPLLEREGKKPGDPYSQANNILKMVTGVKELYDIEMAVEHTESLLADVIPVWRIEY